MLDAPIGFAFSAGMVAAFNPCGFALLPAYLSLFLAVDGQGPTTTAGRLRRAAAVAACVSLGFVAVFGLGGLLITRTAVTVQRYTPWMTVVIGLALIPLGAAMLRGWTPKLRLPRIGRAGGTEGPAAMFWFGVSYATVSLSCTIPAFLVSVAGTFSTGGTWAGMAVFAAYTAGMAAVLVAVTMAVAGAHAGLLARLRRVLPHVNRAAGVLTLLAGAYVAYYGWYELRLDAGADPPAGPVAAVSDASGAVTRAVSALGPGTVAALGAVCVLSLVLLSSRRRR